MENLIQSVGLVVFVVGGILALCWLFLPFLLLSKLSEQLKVQQKMLSAMLAQKRLV